MNNDYVVIDDTQPLYEAGPYAVFRAQISSGSPLEVLKQFGYRMSYYAVVNRETMVEEHSTPSLQDARINAFMAAEALAKTPEQVAAEWRNKNVLESFDTDQIN